MFCYQCEQTAGCKACTGNMGICGKKADTAEIQDKLTGAGKATLVNLVCRFYEPTQGQVLIDGRDARERSQLCYTLPSAMCFKRPTCSPARCAKTC